jgi:hypothetical protein
VLRRPSRSRRTRGQLTATVPPRRARLEVRPPTSCYEFRCGMDGIALHAAALKRKQTFRRPFANACGVVVVLGNNEDPSGHAPGSKIADSPASGLVPEPNEWASSRDSGREQGTGCGASGGGSEERRAGCIETRRRRAPAARATRTSFSLSARAVTTDGPGTRETPEPPPRHWPITRASVP